MESERGENVAGGASESQQLTPRNRRSSTTSTQSLNPVETKDSSQEIVRNLAGFWLLGLCNNFAYVVMLSAAHDILHPTAGTNGTNETTAENRTGKLVEYCNPIGTGAILLADILPGLVTKLAAPMYIHFLPYSLKVWVVIVLGAASFPMVAFGGNQDFWLTIGGVVLASAGSGIGEVTFLSLTSHFGKNCVSTWSSGTGGAGVFGALSYAGLTAVGVSPRDSLLLMLVIPVTMAISYFLLLVQPPTVNDSQHRLSCRSVGCTNDEETDNQTLFEPDVAVRDASQQVHSHEMSCFQRLLLIKPLLKLMIPLMLVYFAEYFINQGLFELLYFANAWLPRMQQYRWYQVIYQIGVFISRSSVNVVHIPFISIFAVLQFGILSLLTCQVFYKYIPNIWIVFVIILFEGLMGGGAYVNAFYRITKESIVSLVLALQASVIHLGFLWLPSYPSQFTTTSVVFSNCCSRTRCDRALVAFSRGKLHRFQS